MNPHLTSPQLLSALDGAPEPAATAHLHACPRCQAELLSLRSTLADFRHATSSLAAATLAAHPHPARTPLPSRWRLALPLSLASAALVVALSLTSTLHPTHPASPDPQSPAHQAPSADDDSLLQSVSDDIDQPVPTSLRILAGPLPARALPTSTSPRSPERIN